MLVQKKPAQTAAGKAHASLCFSLSGHASVDPAIADTYAEYHGPIEYFLASDPSAVIEHTNRVLFLEDGDVAAIQDGSLKIHRFNKDRKEESREIQVPSHTILLH